MAKFQKCYFLLKKYTPLKMLKLLFVEFNYSYGLKLSLKKKRHLGILNYLLNALTKTKSFYLLMVASRRHYWCYVKLLSAAVTFFLQIGQDIEMFITKRTPSAHAVSNSGGQFYACRLVYWVLLRELTKNRAGVLWIKSLRSWKIQHGFILFMSHKTLKVHLAGRTWFQWVNMRNLRNYWVFYCKHNS